MRKETAAACGYLQKAVEKGYEDWEGMKGDDSLDNIRGSDCYKAIVGGR